MKQLNSVQNMKNNQGLNSKSNQRPIYFSSIYLKLEISEPQNCRKDWKNCIRSLWGNLNDFKSQPECIKLVRIVHPVQPGAAGLVEVVVGGGWLDLVLGGQAGVSLGSRSELVEDVVVPLLVRLVRYTRLFQKVILKLNCLSARLSPQSALGLMSLLICSLKAQ